MRGARDHSARRRARRALAPLPAFSEADLAAYWEELGAYACVYCGAPFEHADHFKPRALGGVHELWNLVPACAPCNLSKADQDPIKWLASRMSGLA
ncbi:HNH endonuclease [Kitasatospora purpeofusca]|uniref:HNH endonuclease n=1 Tax=Kitasatospora purpeofusca TaxID=67352 RepID=UPI00338EC3D0